VQLAGVLSGIAAAVAGQDAAGINVAAASGSNAVANNWLQPKEQEQRRQAQRSCDTGNSNACAVIKALSTLDVQREAGNDGTLYKGITKGLIALLQSPASVPVELIDSIVQNGAGDTVIALLKGVALLPTNIANGLQSDDPEVRGRAMVDALATTAGAAAVTRAGVKVWTAEAPGGVNTAMLNELTTNGVKFTPENVIATARSPNGQVVFLETGNAQSGLMHIIKEHGSQFAGMGVSEAQIPGLITRAVSEGNIVGYQGRGTGRPIYQVMVNGQPQQIAITTSSNGYIVGANPRGGK
jgi:hypothetical protein